MWICPDCKRQFKKAHQFHSCAKVEVDKHFAGKPVQLKSAFDKLLTEVGKFTQYEINSVKSGILIKNDSTFLGIKTRKDHLVIEFFSDKEIHEFPVYKTLKISKNRIVHFVTLEQPEQVDKQCIEWIKKSFGLIKAGKK